MAALLDRLPDSETVALAVMLAERPHGVEDVRAGIRDCLDKIGQRTIREEVMELERALREAEEAGNHAEVQELLLRRMELQRTMPT